MATRIPTAFIDEVREKTNIVDLISQTVQLHKSGKNLFGLCPFHEERTPSFSVNEEKQIFHCFSCHRGGNVFKFLMELEQLSFPEAVLKVAAFSGIKAPDSVSTHENSAQHSQTQALQALYQDAQQFYRHLLTKAELGETALTYLQNRHLDASVIDTFKLGFAPDQPDLLLNFFKNRQVERALLVRSGLFVQKDNGELMDRFRNRIMFPIQDANGRTIAFSGRALATKEHEPKYLNSPETKLFQKRETLYHYATAKLAIREQKRAILFEGFMDVIAAERAGVKNGIASMGTSLTSQQLYLLARLTNRLTICYDGDEPGQKATNEALSLLKHKDFEVTVVSLPDGKDPDEFVNEFGAKAFKQQLQQHLLTPIAFQLQRLQKQYNLTVDSDKLAFIHEALTAVVEVESTVEQELALKEVAALAQIDAAALQNEFINLQRQYTRKQRAHKRQQRLIQQEKQPPTPQITQHQDRGTISEQRLLRLALQSETVDERLVQDDDFRFNQEQIQQIFDAWQAYQQKTAQPSLAQFSDQLDASLQQLLTEIELQADDQEPISDDQINDYQQNIINARIEARIKAAQQKIKAAAEVGDDQAQADWLNKLFVLKRQLDITSN